MDLKRLCRDKMGLAPEQIELLRRFETALEVAASAIDGALFAFMYGLQIDRNGASVDAILSTTHRLSGDACAGNHRFGGVQPTLIQVPPTWPRSISATFRPALAKAIGRSLPPRLLPITIAS